MRTQIQQKRYERAKAIKIQNDAAAKRGKIAFSTAMQQAKKVETEEV